MPARTWWTAAFSCLTLALLLLFMQCSRQVTEARRFRGWGLPTNLGDVATGLRALSLQGPIDRIDWVDCEHLEGLERLDLSGTQVRTAQTLRGCRRLTELDLRGAPVERLGPLPDSLRLLDVRDTLIEEPGRLSPNLVALRIGGQWLRDLGTLPGGLQRLVVQRSGLWDLEALPQGITEFSMRGVSQPGMQQRLPELPLGLRFLELVESQWLVDERLPEGLVALSLSRGPVRLGSQGRPLSCSDLPAGLQVFRLLDGGIRCSQGLPPDLHTLELRASQPSVMAHVQKLANLRVARLGGPTVGDVAQIPDGVRALELAGYQGETLNLGRFVQLEELAVTLATDLRDLGELPAGLKRLNLSGTCLPLPPLPKGLESLTLSCRGVDRLPSLPEGLKELDISGCLIGELPDLSRLLPALHTLRLARTTVSTLPPLPPSLRTIDLSNTPITDLVSLPPSIEVLTLHLDQIGRLTGVAGRVNELHMVPAIGTALVGHVGHP